MVTLNEDRVAVWAGAVFPFLLFLASPAEAHHWDDFVADEGHAVPSAGTYPSPCPQGANCQPIIAQPPSPDPTVCSSPVTDLTSYNNRCSPFSKAATFEEQSCCLQFDLRFDRNKGEWRAVPIRGYQLVFGPWVGGWATDPTKSDDYKCAYAELPNQTNLANDPPVNGQPPTYEYMVGFEFWQNTGSHHFILFDLLGPYNNPDQPRSCTPDPNGDACQQFANLPSKWPAGSPQNNDDLPQYPGEIVCGNDPAAGVMRSVPLAGSPGAYTYFPVPYPDGVGIKLARGHIFRMQHHLQKNYTPQQGKVWINVYTVPAVQLNADQKLLPTITKEAHLIFDGSGTLFLVPPRTMARTQGLWIAPRDIELYGLTAHSHKRNILFTADLVGTDGQPKDVVPRAYPRSKTSAGSSRFCGGFEGCASTDPMSCDLSKPPMHLFESTDWQEHEQCPFWREDGSNDTNGAMIIKQGEGIRYECWVNNGVTPVQALAGLGVPASATDGVSRIPPGILAVQTVPVEPRDVFGRVVREKFSCEEIPGVIPGVPFFGAINMYQNRPCLPDVLKDSQGNPLPTSGDYSDPQRLAALLHGGQAPGICSGEWTQFAGSYDGYTFPGGGFHGKYTGNCVPASIGFAESEDDEMCILLGLYGFTNDDLVKGTPDRLPTDVGR